MVVVVGGGGGFYKVSTCSVEVIQLSLSKHHTTSQCSANRINLLTCRRANWGIHGSDLRATGGALGPGAQLAKMSVVKHATTLRNGNLE